MLEASARSLLARWIPGGIWYAAGRATLLSLRQVPTPALTTVAALELTVPLLVGMVMGTLLLAANRRLPGGIWWLAPVGAFIAALALRPVVNRVLRWYAHRRGVEPMNLPQRGYLVLVGWTAIYWLWAGGHLRRLPGGFPHPRSRPTTGGGGGLHGGVGGRLRRPHCPAGHRDLRGDARRSARCGRPRSRIDHRGRVPAGHAGPRPDRHWNRERSSLRRRGPVRRSNQKVPSERPPDRRGASR